MPEGPDFDQIAYDTVGRIWASTVRDQGMTNEIHAMAEQLRRVWNARGAADLATITEAVESAGYSLDAEWGDGSSRELDNAVDALKALDR